MSTWQACGLTGPWGVSLLLLVVTSFDVFQGIRRLRLYPQAGLQDTVSQIVTANATGCIPSMGVGEAFGHTIDFLSYSLSASQAENLAALYNRSVCQ